MTPGTRYLVALALGASFLASSANAQISGAGRPGDYFSGGSDGPVTMFGRLIGEWIYIGRGDTGGGTISIDSTGDVLQSQAPRARVSPTIEAGGNFAFEGRYNPPDGPIFRCVYHVDFVTGDVEANFTLVRGPRDACSRGVFKRKARLF